jgi:hypothetical protein
MEGPEGYKTIDEYLVSEEDYEQRRERLKNSNPNFFKTIDQGHRAK